MTNVRFEGANLTRTKLTMVGLKNIDFKSCVLDYTDFSYSDLSGVCFDNQTLILGKIALLGIGSIWGIPLTYILKKTGKIII